MAEGIVVEGVMSMGNDILSMVPDLYNGYKDRELKRQLAERNERLQKELEERRSSLERRIEDMRLKQEKAGKEADRELQVRLAHENRQLQWELAAFAEYSRRKNALWEIGNRFQVEHFPLYIRKENYYDFIRPDQPPAVKIVFSPPVIGNDSGASHVLEGIDVLMTARLTKFLHDIFDADRRSLPLYEYLGNAWRDKRFRGQSAYRYIFNEFSSEPFIIVDCEVVRGYLTFHLCYWMPGFSEYQVLQVMDGFPIEGILYESMRKRTEEWEHIRFSQMKNVGMDIEEIKELCPREFHNTVLLQKERNIAGDSAVDPVFGYQYDVSDYDAVIEMVALLAEIFVGVIVDLYQMSTGNLHIPCFLDSLKTVTASLPERKGLKDRVEQMAVRQYLEFANPDTRCFQWGSGEENSQAVLGLMDENMRTEYCQDSTAIIVSRLILADILYDAQDEEEAERYFESAWKSWCRLLGLPDRGLESFISEQGIKEAILDEFRNDKDMDRVLQRFDKYSQYPYAANYKEMIGKLMEWYDKDWVDKPHLYL